MDLLALNHVQNKDGICAAVGKGRGRAVWFAIEVPLSERPVGTKQAES